MGAELSADRYDFDNRYQAAYGPYSQDELLEYARAEKDRLNANAVAAPPAVQHEPHIDQRDVEMLTTYSGYLRNGGVDNHHKHGKDHNGRRHGHRSRDARSRHRDRGDSYDRRRRYKSSRRRSHSSDYYRKSSKRRTHSESPDRRHRSRRRRSKEREKELLKKKEEEEKANELKAKEEEEKKKKEKKKKKKKKKAEKELGAGPWNRTHDYFNSIESGQMPWMNKGFPAVPVVAVSPEKLDPQYLSYIQDTYGLMSPKPVVDGMGYPVSGNEPRSHQPILRRASSLDSLHRTGPRSVPHWPTVGQRLGNEHHNKNATLPAHQNNYQTAAMLYSKQQSAKNRGSTLPTAFRYADEQVAYTQNSSLAESIPPDYKKPPHYKSQQPVAKPRRSLPLQTATPHRPHNHKHKPRKITSKTARGDLEDMLSSSYKMNGQPVGMNYTDPIPARDASLYQANKQIYVDDVVYSHHQPISPGSHSDGLHSISYDEFSLNSSSSGSIVKKPIVMEQPVKKAARKEVQATKQSSTKSKSRRKDATNQTDKIHLVMPNTTHEPKVEAKKVAKSQSKPQKIKTKTSQKSYDKGTQSKQELPPKTRTVRTEAKERPKHPKIVEPTRNSSSKKTQTPKVESAPKKEISTQKSTPKKYSEKIQKEQYRSVQQAPQQQTLAIKERRNPTPKKSPQTNHNLSRDNPNHPNLSDLPPQVYYLVPLSSKEVFIDDSLQSSSDKRRSPSDFSDSDLETITESFQRTESSWSNPHDHPRRRSKHKPQYYEYSQSSSEGNETVSSHADTNTSLTMTLSVSESIKASSFVSGNNKVFCLTRSRSDIEEVKPKVKSNKKRRKKKTKTEKPKEQAKESPADEAASNTEADVGHWVLHSISQQSDSTIHEEEEAVKPKTVVNQQEDKNKNEDPVEVFETESLKDVEPKTKNVVEEEIGPITDVDTGTVLNQKPPPVEQQQQIQQQQPQPNFMSPQNGPFYPAIPLTFTNYPPGLYYPQFMTSQLQQMNNSPNDHYRYLSPPQRLPPQNFTQQPDATPNFQNSGNWNKVKSNSAALYKSHLQNRRFSASLSTSEIYSMAKPKVEDHGTSDAAFQAKPSISDEVTQTEKDNLEEAVRSYLLKHEDPLERRPQISAALEQQRNSYYNQDDISQPLSQMSRTQTFPNSGVRKLSLTHSPIPEHETNPFTSIHSKSLDDMSPDVKEVVQKFKDDGILNTNTLTNSELDLMETLTKQDKENRDSLEERTSRILGFDANKKSSDEIKKTEDTNAGHSYLNDVLNGKLDQGPNQPKESEIIIPKSTQKNKKKPATLNVAALMAFTGNHPNYNNRRKSPGGRKPSLTRSRSPNFKQKLHSPPPFANEEDATSFKNDFAFKLEEADKKGSADHSSNSSTLGGRDSCTVDVSDSLLESSVHYKVKNLSRSQELLPPPPKEYLIPENETKHEKSASAYARTTDASFPSPPSNPAMTSYSKNIYSNTPKFHDRAQSFDTTASEESNHDKNKMNGHKTSTSSSVSISATSAPLTSAEMNIVKQLQNGHDDAKNSDASNEVLNSLGQQPWIVSV